MVTLSYPSKITACITVINIKFIVQQAIFLSEVTKQSLLVADAHALIFSKIIIGSLLKKYAFSLR